MTEKIRSAIDAQDEIIKIFMAPMQAELDRVNAEINAQAEEDAIIEKKISQGLCVASHCVFCSCKECEVHNLAYDIVDGKPATQPALDALVKGGFTNKEARKWFDIFDELGIFTEVELFGK
jgi:uncharacterized protein YbaR (Trm112 family)